MNHDITCHVEWKLYPVEIFFQLFLILVGREVIKLLEPDTPLEQYHRLID